MDTSSDPGLTNAEIGVYASGLQGSDLACRNYPANFSGIFPGIWIFLLPKVAKKAWRFLRKV